MSFHFVMQPPFSLSYQFIAAAAYRAPRRCRHEALLRAAAACVSFAEVLFRYDRLDARHTLASRHARAQGQRASLHARAVMRSLRPARASMLEPVKLT